jgi:hypothetical protein
MKARDEALAAGFNSLSEAREFSKMYSFLLIYNCGQIDDAAGAAAIVTEIRREWAYKELLKMGVPDGAMYVGSFEDALKWFFENRRTQTKKE